MCRALLSILLFTGVSVGQGTITPLSVISESGSPIVLSGMVRCGVYERFGLSYSCRADISGKNTSKHPILLVVTGFSDATNPNQTFEPTFKSARYFLYTKPLANDDSFDNVEYLFPYDARGGNAVPVAPKSTYGAVLFVQFSDGEIWGDPEIGEDFLNEEKQNLAELKRLTEVLRTKGAEALTEEILRHGPNPTEPTIRGILAARYNEGKNVDDLVATIDKWLSSAEKYLPISSTGR